MSIQAEREYHEIKAKQNEMQTTLTAAQNKITELELQLLSAQNELTELRTVTTTNTNTTSWTTNVSEETGE